MHRAVLLLPHEGVFIITVLPREVARDGEGARNASFRIRIRKREASVLSAPCRVELRIN
jgi:hypothetical protein